MINTVLPESVQFYRNQYNFTGIRNIRLEKENPKFSRLTHWTSIAVDKRATDRFESCLG